MAKRTTKGVFFEPPGSRRRSEETEAPMAPQMPDEDEEQPVVKFAREEDEEVITHRKVARRKEADDMDAITPEPEVIQRRPVAKAEKFTPAMLDKAFPLLENSYVYDGGNHLVIRGVLPLSQVLQFEETKFQRDTEKHLPAVERFFLGKEPNAPFNCPQDTLFALFLNTDTNETVIVDGCTRAHGIRTGRIPDFPERVSVEITVASGSDENSVYQGYNNKSAAKNLQDTEYSAAHSIDMQQYVLPQSQSAIKYGYAFNSVTFPPKTPVNGYLAAHNPETMKEVHERMSFGGRDIYRGAPMAAMYAISIAAENEAQAPFTRRVPTIKELRAFYKEFAGHTPGDDKSSPAHQFREWIVGNTVAGEAQVMFATAVCLLAFRSFLNGEESYDINDVRQLIISKFGKKKAQSYLRAGRGWLQSAE